MRRWSGLCFGLAVLSLAIGVLVGFYAAATRGIFVFHGVESLADVQGVLAHTLPPLALGAVASACLGVIGLVLWIREARAPERVDAAQEAGSSWS